MANHYAQQQVLAPISIAAQNNVPVTSPVSYHTAAAMPVSPHKQQGQPNFSSVPHLAPPEYGTAQNSAEPLTNTSSTSPAPLLPMLAGPNRPITPVMQQPGVIPQQVAHQPQSSNHRPPNYQQAGQPGTAGSSQSGYPSTPYNTVPFNAPSQPQSQPTLPVLPFQYPGRATVASHPSTPQAAPASPAPSAPSAPVAPDVSFDANSSGYFDPNTVYAPLHQPPLTPFNRNMPATVLPIPGLSYSSQTQLPTLYPPPLASQYGQRSNGQPNNQPLLPPHVYHQHGGHAAFFDRNANKNPNDSFENPEELMSMVKGISNPVGENHCFLNVLLQSLYRMTFFRDEYLTVKDHICASRDVPCVFCDLQTTLLAYKMQSQHELLDPVNLRNALANIDPIFMRGEVGDSGEALMKLLEILHADLCRKKSYTGLQTLSDAELAKQCDETSHCLIHRTFGMYFNEHTECQHCNQFDLHHYAELVRLVPTSLIEHPWLGLGTKNLSAVISEQFKKETAICKNEKCRKEVQVQKYLLEAPFTFTIQLVWQNANVGRYNISNVIRSLDESFPLRSVFESYSEQNPTYRLQGLISYHGNHYVTYQLVRATGNAAAGLQWVRFDDSRLDIFDSWNSCVENMMSNSYQPVLVWYVRS